MLGEVIYTFIKITVKHKSFSFSFVPEFVMHRGKKLEIYEYVHFNIILILIEISNSVKKKKKPHAK